jgi:hypothetical protein
MILESPDRNAKSPKPEPVSLPSPRTTPGAKQRWSKPPKLYGTDGDEAIRAAYGEGLPMTTIAKVMGMSHQRVSQIVRR